MPDADEPPIAQFDPDRFRDLGHRTVDRIAAYFDGLADRPVYVQADPEAVAAAFDDPLPETGEDPAAILADVEDRVVGHATHTSAPRFFGYVMGSGAPLGVLAQAVASAVNMNVGGWHPGPSATEVERQCVRWLAEAVGYPADCGGLLTSGGTMANVTALLTAFRSATDYDTRETGLQDPERPRYTLYVADHEGHASVVRAADVLNLGREAVRHVPSDDDLRMDVDALERMLDGDGAAGEQPFCVVGQAGSINVSAIDPLEDIADVCAERDLWFHVDGACGGVGAMVPEFRDRFAGMARADSLTVDPHKWLYVPKECGAVLVRDQEALGRTFGLRADYLRGSVVETPEEFDFYEFGPQLTREFRALKLWVLLRRYGLEGYRAHLRRSVACAEHLDDLVRAHEDFQAVQEPNLFIYSFRYVPGDVQSALADQPESAMARVHEYLDDLTQAMTDAVVESGLAFLTTTRIRERQALRMSICSHLTDEDDIEVVFEALAETGARLDDERRDQASLPV